MSLWQTGFLVSKTVFLQISISVVDYVIETKMYVGSVFEFMIEINLI